MRDDGKGKRNHGADGDRVQAALARPLAALRWGRLELDEERRRQ